MCLGRALRDWTGSSSEFGDGESSRADTTWFVTAWIFSGECNNFCLPFGRDFAQRDARTEVGRNEIRRNLRYGPTVLLISLYRLLLWQRCGNRPKSLNRGENFLGTFLAKRQVDPHYPRSSLSRLSSCAGDRVTFLQFLTWDRGDLRRGGRDGDGLEIRLGLIQGILNWREEVGSRVW